MPQGSSWGTRVRAAPSIAIIDTYHQLTDLALHALATIVHGADTADKTLTSESIGLEAVAEGFGRMAQAADDDDHETNQRAWIVYDTLYRYCEGTIARLQRD